MEFFEVIEARASVRSYRQGEIADAELVQIVDAGRRAPSGYNRQAWQFIVIRDPAIIAKLGEVQGCIAEASAAIAIVMDENATGYWKEDAGAAIENMLLAVTALGYASLWVEGYVLPKEDWVKEVLGVPPELRVLAILPIGKPGKPPTQADKKPLADITHADRFGNPWPPAGG